MSEYRTIKEINAVKSPEGDKVSIVVNFENGESEVFNLGGKRAERAVAAIVETYKDSAYLTVGLRSDFEAAEKFANRRTSGYTRYGVFYSHPTFAVRVY